MPGWNTLRVYGSLGMAGFVASVAAVSAGWIQVPVVELAWQPFGGKGYSGRGSVQAGGEIALVFIGSPTCVWSTAKSLPAIVERAKLTLGERADSVGQEFVAIAVIRAASADRGTRFARRFGVFDEVMAGRGWHNIGLLKYVYQDFSGRAATPQILVVERTMHIGPPRSITDERVLVRRVGLQSIEDWLESGAPLPSSTSPDRPATSGR